MELLFTVHVAEQWRHDAEEKEEEEWGGGGEGEGHVFTILQREQWRHGAEEEEDEEEVKGERKGEGEELVESFLCVFARRVIVYSVVIQLQQK